MYMRQDIGIVTLDERSRAPLYNGNSVVSAVRSRFSRLGHLVSAREARASSHLTLVHGLYKISMCIQNYFLTANERRVGLRGSAVGAACGLCVVRACEPSLRRVAYLLSVVVCIYI